MTIKSMNNITKATKYFLFVAMLLTTIAFSSCRISTNDLAEEVKNSMSETELFKNGSIKIASLILTNKSGNEYSGVLETYEPNGKFTYSVEVIYDGENIKWEILK